MRFLLLFGGNQGCFCKVDEKLCNQSAVAGKQEESEEGLSLPLLSVLSSSLVEWEEKKNG